MIGLWRKSRATVEGDEIFPEDVEADQVGAGDVAAGGSAVRVGNSEEGSDLAPSGGVDTSHGLVGRVQEVVLELAGSSLVGETGNEFETTCWNPYSSYLMPL